MNYWLMKTEPELFSIADLARAEVEPWDGIRNYQARNIMRDDMKIGDKVFIYHSRTQPIGIAGEAEVASEPYPDPTQFDPKEKYYDPKSDPENPRWILVDIRYRCQYKEIVTLQEIKQTPGLEDMMVARKGSRLSIQPVTAKEWDIIQTMTEKRSSSET